MSRTWVTRVITQNKSIQCPACDSHCNLNTWSTCTLHHDILKFFWLIPYPTGTRHCCRDIVCMESGLKVNSWVHAYLPFYDLKGPQFSVAVSSGGAAMGMRGDCNVGEESGIGRGRGGCIGEYTSRSSCQRLLTGGDLLHGEAMSHSRREGSFGLKPHRCGLSSRATSPSFAPGQSFRWFHPWLDLLPWRRSPNT